MKLQVNVESGEEEWGFSLQVGDGRKKFKWLGKQTQAISKQNVRMITFNFPPSIALVAMQMYGHRAARGGRRHR